MKQFTILGKSIFCDYLQFILTIQCSKRPFRAALCSNKTHFRVLRARGAREPKKVYDMIIFISRRFQRAIACPNQSTHFYVVSGTHFRTLRACRGAQTKKKFMTWSFLYPDSSKELSHAQIHPQGPQTVRNVTFIIILMTYYMEKFKAWLIMYTNKFKNIIFENTRGRHASLPTHSESLHNHCPAKFASKYIYTSGRLAVLGSLSVKFFLILWQFLEPIYTLISFVCQSACLAKRDFCSGQFCLPRW